MVAARGRAEVTIEAYFNAAGLGDVLTRSSNIARDRIAPSVRYVAALAPGDSIGRGHSTLGWHTASDRGMSDIPDTRERVDSVAPLAIGAYSVITGNRLIDGKHPARRLRLGPHPRHPEECRNTHERHNHP